MKAKEIKKGGLYTAKVSGKLVTVRVDEIRVRSGFKKDTTVYDVTNLSTGRKTTFRSAMKFRSEVKPVEKKGAAKQLPDPTKSDTTSSAETTLSSVPQTTLKKLTVTPSTQESSMAQSVSLGNVLRSAANKKPAGREPTEEQQAILDAGQKIVRQGGGVLVIEAGAGTGKTTTDRMLADVLPGNGQYTAFNAALTHESAEKFRGTRVACNTTHSLAFRAVGKQFAHRLGDNRVRSSELAKMLGLEDLILPTDDPAKPRRLAAGFLWGQVNGAIRRFCQSADKEVSADHFKYLDGIDMPSPDGTRRYDNNQKVRDYLLPFARKAWADLSDPEGTLPFSHDCYVKLWQLNDPVISADYILLDEAQDTAPVMLDVLQQQVEAGATLLLVGDSAQQIYEWRGAVNAMAAFPGAPRLFLSQSFRFGEAIAEVANRVLETLEDRTPLRLKGLASISSRIDEIQKPTAILTRTNACAVNKLLTAIAEGRRPFLVGGGSYVLAFVSGARDLQEGRSTSHPDLACFATWAEVQEYAGLDDGEDLRLMVKLIDTFGCQTIGDALAKMPREEDADLVISTAHKSKGREWDKVQLAGDFPTVSKCQDSDRKLLYVSVTRAKLILDVSRCPFFTGRDSLSVDDIVGTRPDPQAPSIIPPTPVTPTTGVYTWSKSKDGQWLVKGPSGNTGREVTVERRDGSKSHRVLKNQVAFFDGGVGLYKV